MCVCLRERERERRERVGLIVFWCLMLLVSPTLLLHAQLLF